MTTMKKYVRSAIERDEMVITVADEGSHPAPSAVLSWSSGTTSATVRVGRSGDDELHAEVIFYDRDASVPVNVIALDTSVLVSPQL